MRLVIVTPAPAGSHLGNRLTALRYARLLRQLGHSVRVLTSWAGEGCDALIALHARKSHGSIVRFVRAHPERRICLVLTGTDLYVDLPSDPKARESVELADVRVVLQAAGRERIARPARVIVQSAQPVSRVRRRGRLEVLLLGHLRPVKDPFRAALAARTLPTASRVVILHAGRALSATMARRAREEMRRNPRYRWLGDLPHARARRLLARADVFVLSSHAEGGSLALVEAIVAGVPVLASRIASNVAMLGARHPGLFRCGDTPALARLLSRCEREPRFLAQLAQASRGLAPRYGEARERAALRELVRSLRTPAAGKKRPPRSP